mgnify:CR=1 FL=1
MGGKPHIEAAAALIMDIADHPIMTFAPAVAEVATTDGFGIFAETANDIDSGTGHAGLLCIAARAPALLRATNSGPSQQPLP